MSNDTDIDIVYLEELAHDHELFAKQSEDEDEQKYHENQAALLRRTIERLKEPLILESFIKFDAETQPTKNDLIVALNAVQGICISREWKKMLSAVYWAAEFIERLKQIEWQPIESAPQDGQEIIVCEAGTSRVEFVRYIDGEWLDRTTDNFINATHWMPLSARQKKPT